MEKAYSTKHKESWYYFSKRYPNKDINHAINIPSFTKNWKGRFFFIKTIGLPERNYWKFGRADNTRPSEKSCEEASRLLNMPMAVDWKNVDRSVVMVADLDHLWPSHQFRPPSSPALALVLGTMVSETLSKLKKLVPKKRKREDGKPSSSYQTSSKTPSKVQALPAIPAPATKAKSSIDPSHAAAKKPDQAAAQPPNKKQVPETPALPPKSATKAGAATPQKAPPVRTASKAAPQTKPAPPAVPQTRPASPVGIIINDPKSAPTGGVNVTAREDAPQRPHGKAPYEGEPSH